MSNGDQAKPQTGQIIQKRLIGVTLRKTWPSSLICSQNIYINTKTMFKAEVNRLSTRHIQTRQVKSRADLPWVTHEIVKLIRKRDKLYTKLKRSCSNKSHYTEKFKHLKSTIQKRIRKAYWSYLEWVIFSDTPGPGHIKKFYNFVKHKKTENIGIAPLNSEGQTHSDPRPTYSTNNMNPSLQSLCHSASNN